MKGSKATVQTVASGLMVVAFQRLTAGRLFQGGAAFVVAIGLFYGYEELNLRQLPADADDLAALTDAAGDAAREQVGAMRDGDGGDP